MLYHRIMSPHESPVTYVELSGAQALSVVKGTHMPAGHLSIHKIFTWFIRETIHVGLFNLAEQV